MFRRTGVNLKEMTGTVINAPLDIAQKVKRNVFGSADNLPAAVADSECSFWLVTSVIFSGPGVSNVGQSVFYENTPLYASATTSHTER